MSGDLADLLQQLRMANFHWAASFDRQGAGYVVTIGTKGDRSANARGWSPDDLSDATAAAIANYSRRAES